VTSSASKLPGLTVTDNDFSDGSGQVTVHTDIGNAILTISSGGTTTTSNPSHIFDQLRDGDALDLNIGYTVSDIHGLSANSSIKITINGFSCLFLADTFTRSGTHRGLLSNRPARMTC
jgi:hypothetical protein